MMHILLLWPSAMLWHLWRILTIRPAFTQLSDSRAVVLSFSAVFMLAGSARWIVFGGLTGVETILNLIVVILFLGFISLRSNRSDSLFASLLGVSALIDSLAVGIGTLGFYDDNLKQVALVSEFVWYGFMFWRFNQAPLDVQRGGYKAGTSTYIDG